MLGMRARLSIGDFSRMTHLSIKALRHYHDLGLLVPAEIDAATGYRYYAPSQVPLAQVIRRFRDLDMPLEEIREVLRAPDVASRNELIAAHARRMETHLAQARSVVETLRSLLDEPAAPPTVAHRSVGAVSALSIAERVSAAGLDAWWSSAFRELAATRATLSVPPAGPPAALYPEEFFTLETGGEVVAYLPVATDTANGNGTAGGATSGRVRLLEIPAAELAVTEHRGGLANLDRTYGALGTYVAEREIGLPGPIREVYVVSALDTEDESRHVTEVCWPIFRTTPQR
jgi:DNA-binding transcriptional MerR regulator